jgi:hypothetical protein
MGGIKKPTHSLFVGQKQSLAQARSMSLAQAFIIIFLVFLVRPL